jgi:hypothetical protein
LVATDSHGTLLARGEQDGAPWGTTLAWDDVPDFNRDYKDAMAGFAGSDATNGESTTKESTTSESTTDESTGDAANSPAAGDEESSQGSGLQDDDDSA